MRSRRGRGIRSAGIQIENTIGVELRGAAKTYRNAGAVVEAVRGIDLSIKRGETVALLGPNGAGKSTTIDLLLGLIAPDSGAVSLLRGPPKDAVARGMVAAMLQAGALIRDVKVRELIAMVAAPATPIRSTSTKRLGVGRPDGHRRPSHPQAVGRPGPAGAVRGRPRPGPGGVDPR